MKALHYINLVFYTITIILYATIYLVIYGLYAQFFLGIIQVIIAFTLLFYKKNFNLIIKKHFLYYWILVLTTLVVIAALSIKSNFSNSFVYTSILFVIPMLIATYFVYITYLIKKNSLKKDNF